MTRHRYSDMSNLNAGYDPDVLQGLGAARMRQHRYYDVSDLNAPYDQIPMQGLGAGSISSGTLGSLGAEATEYPWKEYSKATASLQAEINAWLKDHGYCPIGTDGKLGPTTCGAAAFYRDQSGFGGAKNISGGVPGTCQSSAFVPKTPPCAGASSPAPATPPATPVVATPATARITGGGDWMWIAIGGLVAAGAVGAAIYYKKKRR